MDEVQNDKDELVLWAGGGDDDDDIWDDSELIKAYEAARAQSFERLKKDYVPSRARKSYKKPMDRVDRSQQRNQTRKTGAHGRARPHAPQQAAKRQRLHDTPLDDFTPGATATASASATAAAEASRPGSWASTSIPSGAPYAGHRQMPQLPSSGGSKVVPPTPPLPPSLLQSDEALCNLMLSWYHSGFWTGFSAALREQDPEYTQSQA